MRSTQLLILGTALMAVGCQSRSGTDAPGTAPDNLSYGSDFFGLTNCAELSPLVPEVEGGALTFTIVPDLPLGLILNPATGAISGTPVAPVGSMFHTVTATNSLGSTSAGFTVSVDDPAAPGGLAYSEPQASYTAFTPIASNTPSLAQGGASSYEYSISPELPSGLSFDSSTGVISGVPSANFPARPFLVRAADCIGGETSGQVWIEVGGGAGGATAAQPNLAIIAGADGTLNLVQVDPVTGLLTSFGSLPGGGAIADLEVAPNQSALYTLLEGQNVVQGLAIDPAGGGLVPFPGGPTTLDGASSVGDLIISDDGGEIYVSDPSGSQVFGFRVGAFGALEPLPGSPFAITGTGSGAQGPTELEFASDGSALYVLDRTSESVSVLALGADGVPYAEANAPVGGDPQDLAQLTLSNGTRIVYVVNAEDATVSVFQVDPFTPGLTLLQTRDLPSGSYPAEIQVVNVGGKLFLYAAKLATQLIGPLEINPFDGTLSPITNVLGQQGISGFDFSADGSLGFVTSAANGSVLSVIPQPGTGLLVPAQSGGVPLDPFFLGTTPVGVAVVSTANPLKLVTKQVFTTSEVDGTITGFDTAANGTLSAPDTVTEGGRPVALAVRPDGRRVIAVDGDGFAGDDLFSWSSIDGQLGSMQSSELGAPLFAGLGGARDVAIDPSGRFLLVSRSGFPGQVFSFQLDDLGRVGAGSVDQAGNEPMGIAVAPNGKYVYVANASEDRVSQHRIDSGSGALSLVSFEPVGQRPVDVALPPSGRYVYVLEAGTGTIGTYTVNPSSGVLSLLGVAPDAGFDATDIAVDAAGQVIVTTDRASGELKVFRVSTLDGSVLVGVPLFESAVASGGQPVSAAFNADGSVLYVRLADSGEVRTFAHSNGTLTQIDSDAAGAGAGGVAVRRVLE